jgi:hypothetical protein
MATFEFTTRAADISRLVILFAHQRNAALAKSRKACSSSSAPARGHHTRAEGESMVIELHGYDAGGCTGVCFYLRQDGKLYNIGLPDPFGWCQARKQLPLKALFIGHDTKVAVSEQMVGSEYWLDLTEEAASVYNRVNNGTYSDWIVGV